MVEQIIKTEYSEIMQKSYIDYAMSVICARALPDARDGLKPVQRRVLYAMEQLGLNYDKPHRKSARIVGDTMGKYHPHGDSSIYDALVVLEQDFKKGMALIDGHGNFGSIEGDGAAAMRYTEAKLKKFTQELYLADLDKDVVDFVPNFDETEKEPEVLPVKVPNLLINGAEGIAVGMTTSIPTHNLVEVLDAVIAYMKQCNFRTSESFEADITTSELMEHIKGPDFPTGGLVVNKRELVDIYENGTGKIKLRGKVEFEPGARKTDKDKLVITEIPYTMIGAGIGKFISDVCNLIETKKTSDITDISNESSKQGIRIALELKKNADIDKLKNMLYKKTRLEDTFGVNILAIVDGRPETLSLKKVLEHHISFQFEITTRKYTNLLSKELEQKEIKEGLIKACNIIDLIIEILRGSDSLKDAKDCLINGNTDPIRFKHKESKIYASNLNFTEKQAQAILDLRLYRLIGLEILALQKDYEKILEKIAKYEEILSNRNTMAKVIMADLVKIKREYGLPRKTMIIDAEEAVYEENKIEEQEVVFMMDRFGYAKTIDIPTYDRNREAVDTENKYVFHCMNTEKICIFSDHGNLHQVKVLDVPFVKHRDKGTPVDNLCNYDSKGENIVFLCSSRKIYEHKLLFTTKSGMMKIVNGSEFDVVKRTVAATKLSEGDLIVGIDFIHMTDDLDIEDDFAPILLSGGEDDGSLEGHTGFDDAFDTEQMNFGGFMLDHDISPMQGESAGVTEQRNVNTNQFVILQTKNGVFLRFPLGEIPEKKKGAVGVRGIKLMNEDEVEKVYVLDAGDNEVIQYKGKDVELRKLKTTKRDTKGTKIRV